ncbi:hypothetical protein HZC53_00020 [Candidatus Uhrbacteria bacterium]|nr:hypothetical protein [Candidatus Uhrbacteria bacterium]
MQKTNKIEGQDVMVELKSVSVTEQDMAMAIGKLDLTADKIAAFISREPGKFEIVYAKNFTVDTKANMRRVDHTAPALISAIQVKGYIFFETTDAKYVDRFARILRPLTQVKDKSGKTVDDLYFVGFGQKRYVQNVLTPDNQVITLSQGQTGITSVRYDQVNQRFIAILRDQVGVEALMSLDIEVMLRNPQALTQIENWQTIIPINKQTPAIALSRPKIKGNDVKFVVNFDRNARPLTLVGKKNAIWGDAYPTTEIQIGFLSGSDDLMVGYQTTETDLMISVTRTLPNHPAANYFA